MINKQRLRSQWRRALLLSNEGDWLKAQVAHEIFEATPTKEKAYAVMVDIGVQDHASTKAGLKRMYEALSVVPGEDVWIAVGWRKVLQLTRLTKRERAAKVKTIRKEAKGGQLPAKVVAKILPKPEKKAPARAPARAPEPSLLELVLVDLTKLARFNPAVVDLLSDRVRKAVEERMRALKRA